MTFFPYILLAENVVAGYLSLLLPLLEKTRSVSGPPPGLEGEVGEVGDRGDRDPPPQDDRRAGGSPGDRPSTQGVHGNIQGMERFRIVSV
jgi:hypothetical protein